MQTPCYLYDSRGIFLTTREWTKAFSSYPTSLFFAVKANNHPQILRTIFKQGFGADVVSLGELKRCLSLGLSPNKILFSGVGKTDKEIAAAIRLKIHAIQVESLQEWERIVYFSRKLKIQAHISLRINPHINVKTNPYIATGLYETKFGIDEKTAFKIALETQKHPTVSLIGLSCHLGSQIQDLKPFKLAGQRMCELALRVQQSGTKLQFIDLGGGLGISYKKEKVPTVSAYAKVLINEIKKSGLKLYLEPGRSIVAKHGILLTSVIRTKKTPKKHFVIVDAAMNDLLRPALYSAFHEITPLKSIKGPKITYDVVGPICETGDFLGLARKLPAKLQPGDILVIKDTGAYGMTMSSNYNMREKAKEYFK